MHWMCSYILISSNQTWGLKHCYKTTVNRSHATPTIHILHIYFRPPTEFPDFPGQKLIPWLSRSQGTVLVYATVVLLNMYNLMVWWNYGQESCKSDVYLSRQIRQSRVALYINCSPIQKPVNHHHHHHIGWYHYRSICSWLILFDVDCVVDTLDDFHADNSSCNAATWHSNTWQQLSQLLPKQIIHTFITVSHRLKFSLTLPLPIPLRLHTSRAPECQKLEKWWVRAVWHWSLRTAAIWNSWHWMG